MSIYRSKRGNIGKLLISKTILILLSANVIVMTPMQSVNTANAQEQTRFVPLFLAPIAASEDNVYVTWWDNKTGNWEVFFARSTDNGETFDNIINLSNAMGRSDDSNIAASEDNVYVTWWDNKTGTREVYFRASTDNGETFGNTIMLNSTIGGGS
ncbi:MAG TPA: sialidase family protein [Nitrososphaeraceae archaeon]|nr:sialidase family protein [Nitrososphaeraceae archaeon]